MGTFWLGRSQKRRSETFCEVCVDYVDGGEQKDVVVAVEAVVMWSGRVV